MSSSEPKQAAAGDADTTYPRPGEPVMPRLLRFLSADLHEHGISDPSVLGADVWKHRSAESCRRLGKLVVRLAHRRLQVLPEQLRSLPLPEPRAVLAELPLERRTSNTLRRRPAAGGGEPWTLGRYLEIPRFGARAMIDLLAALEARDADPARVAAAAALAAAAAAGGEHAAAPPELDAALSNLSDALPLSEEQVNAELMRLHLIERPTSLSRLAQAAVRLGWSPTFRVVAIGGTRVAVQRSRVADAANAYAIASRVVYDWGAATINVVLDQLRVLAAATVGLGFVRSLLSAMKDFQWLDQQRAWFWFSSRPSRLLQNVRKVFSVVPELSLAQLSTALSRTENGAHLPPPAVLARICATLPGAVARGAFVGIERLFDRAVHLGEAERRLVESLESGKHSVRLAEVGALCASVGLSRWTVRRLLDSSPLFETLPGKRFGLVGGA